MVTLCTQPARAASSRVSFAQRVEPGTADKHDLHSNSHKQPVTSHLTACAAPVNLIVTEDNQVMRTSTGNGPPTGERNLVHDHLPWRRENICAENRLCKTSVGSEHTCRGVQCVEAPEAALDAFALVLSPESHTCWCTLPLQKSIDTHGFLLTSVGTTEVRFCPKQERHNNIDCGVALGSTVSAQVAAQCDSWPAGGDGS